jgi:hypothetical protein
MTTTIDQKIKALLPGQTVRIGGTAKCWTTVERSTDGRIVRFVRHTDSGWTVFATAS